ncbi:hypothetical protein NQZ68_008367 [Dissostichus eleginoides]|nr:hypothetical protein NQZ68_008367 [Dissostichus eleginoides]
MVLLGSLPVHRGAQSGIIWLEEIGSECSVCDRFIDGSLLYWFPATEPHEHLCMPFPMTQLRAHRTITGSSQESGALFGGTSSLDPHNGSHRADNHGSPGEGAEGERRGSGGGAEREQIGCIQISAGLVIVVMTNRL